MEVGIVKYWPLINGILATVFFFLATMIESYGTDFEYIATSGAVTICIIVAVCFAFAALMTSWGSNEDHTG